MVSFGLPCLIAANLATISGSETWKSQQAGGAVLNSYESPWPDFPGMVCEIYDHEILDVESFLRINSTYYILGSVHSRFLGLGDIAAIERGWVMHARRSTLEFALTRSGWSRRVSDMYCISDGEEIDETNPILRRYTACAHPQVRLSDWLGRLNVSCKIAIASSRLCEGAIAIFRSDMTRKGNLHWEYVFKDNTRSARNSLIALTDYLTKSNDWDTEVWAYPVDAAQVRLYSSMGFVCVSEYAAYFTEDIRQRLT